MLLLSHLSGDYRCSMLLCVLIERVGGGNSSLPFPSQGSFSRASDLPGEVPERPRGAVGDGLVLGLREALEHGDGAHFPKGDLVLGAAGGKVPQAAACVGHDGDAGGLELLQQDAEEVVLAEDGPGGKKGANGRSVACGTRRLHRLGGFEGAISPPNSI